MYGRIDKCIKLYYFRLIPTIEYLQSPLAISQNSIQCK